MLYLLSIVDYFTIVELFCMCICLLCVIATIIVFFVMNQTNAAIENYEKELRSQSMENAANIGKLQRRVYFIESKMCKGCRDHLNQNP